MLQSLLGVSPQMCGSYPRCVGHPYKTGDWTEWWEVCLTASCQRDPARPPGCEPSSNSCTLRQKEHQDWAWTNNRHTTGRTTLTPGLTCVQAYWSRSMNTSPPCPWRVSWRASRPVAGNEGTAIWPPKAWQRSARSTSIHSGKLWTG